MRQSLKRYSIPLPTWLYQNDHHENCISRYRVSRLSSGHGPDSRQWTISSRRRSISPANSIPRSTRKGASAPALSRRRPRASLLEFLGGAKYPSDQGRRRRLGRRHAAPGRRFSLLPARDRWRRRSRTPAACISTAAAAGAAGSKSPPRTRTSMPSRTCLTASCGRPSTIPRTPRPISAASFTLRPIMKRIRPSVIRCCICNTAAAKMKPAGATRGMPA